MTLSQHPSSTARYEVPGTRRVPLRGAREAGAWPEDDRVEVSVLLRRGSAPKEFPSIEELGATPVSRREYLTRPQFAAIHSALAEDIESVREFAEDHGLVVESADRARRIVQLSGMLLQVTRAFATDVRRFEHPSTPYRGLVWPIQVPRELADAVVGVFGLDTRPVVRPHLRKNLDPQATGYSVLSVGAAYSFPSNLTGAGRCVAILEFGGGYSSEDLENYFGALGRTVPSVTPVSVDGASNAPSGDPNGPDAEVELDIEVAGALAPGATLAVYFAPNTEQGFVDAITTAIHDDVNRPSVVSISWGGPEENWAAQARNAFESATQDGAVQGVTVLAASGDQGASDGEPAGTLAVDFPASSPYVMGCGGTRLVLSGSSVVSETVWNDLSQGEGATGGGVSEEFAKPPFQSGVSVPLAPNGYAGRGVPDVAGNADPETGYAVFVDGAPAVLGGTSAVAPLWAALVARLGEGLGKPLGYADPLLYAPDVAGALRGIDSGTNGGYSAGPGWNPCAGLGSPQGAKLLAALRA